MASKIVNMTARIVERCILDALDEAPDYPYKRAYSIHNYRQKLLVSVLNRVRNHYIVQQDDTPGHRIETLLYCLEEQATIEQLVRESLVRVLEDEPDWINQVEIPDNTPTYLRCDKKVVLQHSQTLTRAFPAMTDFCI